MKTKHLTVISIVACALIVPLMIFSVLSKSSNQARTDAPKAIAASPTVTATAVSITNARVRTTVPGARVSAAYMDIVSPQAITLVKAEAKAAGSTEIHNMAMRDGVMEMRALEELAIPANTVVKLERGGLHIMLLQLNVPINVGDTVPLTLTLKGTDGKPFNVDVQAIAEAPQNAVAHKH